MSGRNNCSVVMCTITIQIQYNKLEKEKRKERGQTSKV